MKVYLNHHKELLYFQPGPYLLCFLPCEVQYTSLSFPQATFSISWNHLIVPSEIHHPHTQLHFPQWPQQDLLSLCFCKSLLKFPLFMRPIRPPHLEIVTWKSPASLPPLCLALGVNLFPQRRLNNSSLALLSFFPKALITYWSLYTIYFFTVATVHGLSPSVPLPYSC